MKAICLCEQPESFSKVYAGDILPRLRGITELDEVIYAKSDILSNADRFADTEILFFHVGHAHFYGRGDQNVSSKLEMRILRGRLCTELCPPISALWHQGLFGMGSQRCSRGGDDRRADRACQ